MSNCNYNCADLGSHEQISCGEHLKGGQSVIGLLDCDHAITDFENQTQLLTAISSGNLILIQNVKAEIPDPSPIESDTLLGCGPETSFDSFDHTVKWDDPNVTSGNVDFYNALNKRTYKLIVYHCTDQKISVYDTTFRFVSMRSAPASNKAKQKFSVTAKATWDEIPALYDAPANVFA